MKFTPKKREQFLEALAETANITIAAQTVGISRVYAYRYRDEDAEFSDLWDDALAIGVEAMEDEARRRAHQGTLKPVFYKGEECGHVQEYSDSLMMFLLKAHKPEKYRDNYDGPEATGDELDDLEIIEYEEDEAEDASQV